jgi:hypothetical protein
MRRNIAARRETGSTHHDGAHIEPDLQYGAQFWFRGRNRAANPPAAAISDPFSYGIVLAIAFQPLCATHQAFPST